MNGAVLFVATALVANSAAAQLETTMGVDRLTINARILPAWRSAVQDATHIQISLAPDSRLRDRICRPGILHRLSFSDFLQLNQQQSQRLIAPFMLLRLERTSYGRSPEAVNGAGQTTSITAAREVSEDELPEALIQELQQAGLTPLALLPTARVFVFSKRSLVDANGSSLGLTTGPPRLRALGEALGAETRVAGDMHRQSEYLSADIAIAPIEMEEVVGMRPQGMPHVISTAVATDFAIWVVRTDVFAALSPSVQASIRDATDRVRTLHLRQWERLHRRTASRLAEHAEQPNETAWNDAFRRSRSSGETPRPVPPHSTGDPLAGLRGLDNAQPGRPNRAEGAPRPPTAPARADVAEAMRRLVFKIRDDCFDGARQQLTFPTRFVFNPDGRARETTMQGPLPRLNQRERACLQATASTVRIPRFNRPSFSVSYPLSI